VMPPKLWEEPRDPYHRWIWRATDNTYLAGFKTQEEAIRYGDLYGYKP
jgi:hypothetical protein